MRDIIVLIAGGYIGWWLALNKEQETRKALTDAKIQLGLAKQEIVKQLKENEKIKSVLEDKGVFTTSDKSAIDR